MDHPKKERDWRTYEHEYSTRIKTAMKDLDPLIQEAVSTIHIIHGPGHPYSLSLDQRVKLLLIKQLVGESNRMFANMLDIFSMLSGIDVSYKTVERLYSDDVYCGYSFLYQWIKILHCCLDPGGEFLLLCSMH